MNHCFQNTMVQKGTMSNTECILLSKALGIKSFLIGYHTFLRVSEDDDMRRGAGAGFSVLARDDFTVAAELKIKSESRFSV